MNRKVCLVLVLGLALTQPLFADDYVVELEFVMFERALTEEEESDRQIHLCRLARPG